jgi:UDPglucose 6-dehydrogenase
MKISILGAGYVGLVSGACFAELGWHVTCIDIDRDRIAALQRGQVPIYEPGLEEIVQRNVKCGRLAYADNAGAAVRDSDIVFIAVGTPPLEDGRADTAAVAAAARDIAPVLSGYTVVVIKSTVPVGTGDYVARLIAQANPDARFAVASNPEFLREGSAIRDFLEPDRIVVGTNDARAHDMLRALYAPLERRNVPIVMTDQQTAELIKYAANSFLAAKVAFINEMADLCDAIGANVDDLGRSIGLDARIGPSFLRPGPGYGGSCFPKDTLALAAQAQEADCPVRIVEAVVASNAHHIRRLVRKIERDWRRGWERLGRDDTSLVGKTVAVLGLAFKSNTDDIRYAASVVLLPQLAKHGVRIRAYDPAAMDNARAAMPEIECCTSAEAALEGADAALILTEWPEFRGLDWPSVRASMASPLVVDLRNLYEPADVAEAGVLYYSLGRPKVHDVLAVPDEQVVRIAGRRGTAVKAQ